VSNTRTRMIRLAVLVAVGASLFGPLALLVTDVPSVDFARFTILISVIAISFGVVAWLGAGAQPDNKVVWIITLFVVGVGAVGLGQFIIANISPELSLPFDNETVVPADLHPLVALTEGIGNAIGTLGQTSLMTFGLLLFPDGRLPSRRWRPVAYFFLVGVLISAIGNITAWLPSNTVAPFAEEGPGHVSIPAAFLAVFMLIGPLLAFASLVLRFRRGDTTERGRIKWIIWGAAIFIPAVLIGSVSGLTYVTVFGVLTLVAAYGIAIIRHRLYDIDVVISRSLVYGALAAFIGIVYVAVVVGIGSVVGTGGEPNTALAITATTLVAVSFQPLRRRFERLANHIVFGRRATPYEVLSEFSQRVAATGGELLGEAARGLVEGTAANRAVVSIKVGERFVPTATWPDPNGQVVDGAEEASFPISHDGTVLGRLSLLTPRGEPLPGQDRQLATEIASAMGLALRNQALTETLQIRVDELRRSRQRLVAVQDETRRKLERDLHDGAQQQLVALKVKLGLAKALAERDGAQRTAALLQGLTADADDTVDALRDFARGVYPPLLEAEGLAVAIRAHARRVPVPVEVVDGGVGRHDRQIETAVYFCVLEALQNVTKYADAGSVRVLLEVIDGTLRFEVVDDGRGFDGVDSGGTGLANMRDRLGAVNGSLEITSDPGRGTSVVGSIPSSARVGVEA
jgi:signal transduction histidine kinase